MSMPIPLPAELTQRAQWVNWRYLTRKGKRTKVPFQPDGQPASSVDPATWNTYDIVCKAYQNKSGEFEGIGFVFGADDPFAGIDLDNCLAESGQPKPWAMPFISTFADTYAEVSPSGKGVKIFAKAKLPGKGKRQEFADGAIEVYDRGRFFTVTGNVLNGCPILLGEHQHDIDELYKLALGGGSTNNGSRANNNEKISQGKRHDTLVSLAGTMRRRAMSVDAIDAALWAENCARCVPPYDRQHIRKIAESAGGWEPGAGPDLLHHPFTDTGNAERLVAMCGRDIRFCSQIKTWLVWDSRRWNSEDTRRIKVLAKRTMRQMYVQAAGVDRPDIRDAAEKHARKSESSNGIHSMLTCAEYEDGIPISVNELDRNNYELNFLNGTLDLKTGQLREHCREDLITKLVHFNYNPQAKCPQFIRFIFRIMGDGPDASAVERESAERMMNYLQKCFGYALTGDVSEKAVFCFFGVGNNGKTTLLEIIRFILAEYSTQVLIDSLMAHYARESNASLADLGDLRGARFVTTSEAEEGQRLAVGKLKYLTQGMGDIKTCRKYENPIQFTATHKLFLDANHKPIVRGAEKAVWNRLKPIPFLVTIQPEEMDKALLSKLQDEAEGICAWLVEGCARWLREGLGDPPEVTEASAAWQAESDRFPAFLEERCIFDAKAWVPVSELWTAYQNWCETNNERFVLAKTDFDTRVRERSCTQTKRNGGTIRAWAGIRFRTVDDDRD